MAIYVGASGVKTPTAIYVGAGGVKTVSAVYVGVGSVKQVWPSWSDGDSIFPLSTDYWDGYHITSRDKTFEHSTPTEATDANYHVPYLKIGWNVVYINNGGFFVSKEQINANSINYLYIEFVLYDTTSTHTAHYTAYCSVASSASSLISSDSGVGSYGNMSATSSGYIYAKKAVIDLRSCTRTGYLKFGCIQTGNNNSDTTNNGAIYMYEAQVYSSDPGIYNPITITVT